MASLPGIDWPIAMVGTRPYHEGDSILGRGGMEIMAGEKRNSGIARSGLALVLSASLVMSSLTGCVTPRDDRIGADDGTDACRA